MKQKNPNSNACCHYVVGDVGDARRAPQGVKLAALNQYLKTLRTKNAANFRVFGASQAKNRGTVTVTVIVTVAVMMVVVVVVVVVVLLLLLLVVGCWLLVVGCWLLVVVVVFVVVVVAGVVVVVVVTRATFFSVS